MIKTKIKTSIVLVTVIVVLAACSSSALNQVPSARTAAQEKSLTLQPCKLGVTPALCGTLKVYENRTARSGRMIDLRVAVIKAKSPKPAPDPIFYLAGGPGNAATEDAAKGNQFPDALNQDRDLVFVDQRGTGGSHRILIPPGPDLSGLTPAEMEAKASEWVSKTLREMDMDPRFYTTSVAMDDLDEVRQALGYDKINLFGHSYGATAAQYYLRQHEDHVRAVVLSGGTLLDIPIVEVWARNGQRALDQILTRCENDSACQQAFPGIGTEFSSLLSRLDQEPVTVPLTSSTNVTYTRDLLAEIIREMTLEARTAVAIPRLIHRAYTDNDWEGITNYYATHGPADWGPQIMAHVIQCSEKWVAFSPEEVARLSADTYLEGWNVQRAKEHAFGCKFTPRGETPEGTAPQPHSQVPVLLLNGDADPQDPPANVLGSKELWPNSLALAEPFQGHSLSDYTAIRCRWSIMTEFIQNGSVQGLQTGCLKGITAPTFDIH